MTYLVVKQETKFTGYCHVTEEIIQGIFEDKKLAQKYANKCGYICRSIASDKDRELVEQ